MIYRLLFVWEGRCYMNNIKFNSRKYVKWWYRRFTYVSSTVQHLRTEFVSPCSSIWKFMLQIKPMIIILVFKRSSWFDCRLIYGYISNSAKFSVGLNTNVRISLLVRMVLLLSHISKHAIWWKLLPIYLQHLAELYNHQHVNHVIFSWT